MANPSSSRGRIYIVYIIKTKREMTVEIREFSISRLTIGAAGNFHDRVRKAIEAATAEALHIEALAPAYNKIVGQLATIVNRQRSYITTDTLEALDKRRDTGVGSIHNQLDGTKNSLVDAKREASARLRPQLSGYKQIRYHEYAKQTLEVRGMIGVLRDPSNAAAVAALGLEADIDALEAANEAFDAAFEQRTREAAAQAEVRDLRSADLVKEAAALYGEIIRTVNAYAIVQPTEGITAFVNTINGYVSAFAGITDKRAGSATPPAADAGEPPKPGATDSETPDGI